MKWFPYMFGACNITFEEIDKMDFYDLTYLKMATVNRNKYTSNMYGFPAME